MALRRELLSTNEVAELLGFTPFTIRRYIQLRKLKAMKLEGSYRVRRTDLEQFLKAREIETEEELAAETIKPAVIASPRRVVRTETKRAPRAARKSKVKSASRRQREEA
ncbi:MAG: helix-turn-helix domain-containing protein [Anaerolineales bacterium]|nr:helix-turn-helix domain-containing protein [Anaerolineales bacterium]